MLDVDYGCGDPSKWLGPGETVLDLGSGSGKICFIAAQIVGVEGRVIGVDIDIRACRLPCARLAVRFVPRILALPRLVLTIALKTARHRDQVFGSDRLDCHDRIKHCLATDKLVEQLFIRLDARQSNQRLDSPLVVFLNVSTARLDNCF